MRESLKKFLPPASEFSRPGESNGRAKLTEDDVRMLRRLVPAEMSCRAAARKYEVSAMVISLIVRRKSWRHVE